MPSSSTLPTDGCFYLLDSHLLERIAQGWKDKKGSGGFGVVYKGYLPEEHGGAAVAVKWFKVQNNDGELSADAQQEISISRILSGRSAMQGYANLVRLLGYCRQPQALVYEWVDGGDLKALLSSPVQLESLSLNQRVSILKGMARGLEVMHHGGDEEIRHKDIKPENAMLG